jgi:hypothetical protein
MWVCIYKLPTSVQLVFSSPEILFQFRARVTRQTDALPDSEIFSTAGIFAGS